MRPFITITRAVPPEEWLVVLRADLAVCEARLRDAKRMNDPMPGHEAWRVELVARIAKLEGESNGAD